MTAKLSILIDANGKAAKAEIDALKVSVEGAGTAAEKMGTKGRKAAGDTAAVGTSASGAAAKVGVLSSAENVNAATATRMGQANRLAAGSMGNLVAQFNGVGVMLASGQNPLTLALQQGTQISQVIGPLGAAGAVKALGGAFLGMLNPISLVTIGTIAAGAALTQWVTGALSAGDATETFADKVDRLSASVQDYRGWADTAGASTLDLVAKFGQGGAQAGALADFLSKLARVQAVDDLDAAVGALTERFGGLSRTELVSTRGGVIAEIDNTFFNLRKELNLTDQQAAVTVRALEQFSNAGTIGEQVTAAQNLYTEMERVFGSVENIPAPLRDALTQAGLLAIEAVNIEGGMDAAAVASERYFDALSRSLDKKVADLGTGRALLAQITEENALRDATLRFGADSVEVLALQANRQRRVTEEALATLDVSESVKDEIRAATEQAIRLGQVDVSSGISAAAGSARSLADWLRISLGDAQALAALGSDQGDDALFAQPVSADPGGVAAARAAGTRSTYRANNPRSTGRSGGAGGGGASEADAERKAVTDLVQSLTDELAILRETDPVQKEMLRNRAALRGATAAERVTITDLITQREAETAAAQQQAETWGFFRDVAGDALTGLISRGESLGDVISNLTVKLLEATAQAALLGTGPLAFLFGGGGNEKTGGGLLGQVLGAVFPGAKKAGGGMITGPGTGTSDDVPIYASNGEFMVNARATQKNRGLLEAINAGAELPRFAAGGAVGGGSPAALSGGGTTAAGPSVIQIDARGARGNAEIEASMMRGLEAAFDRYDREILPRSVARISVDGRRVG